MLTDVLEITNIRTVRNHYQKVWLEHLEIMPENGIPNIFYQYKPNGRRG
jgi:hypothetical protein